MSEPAQRSLTFPVCMVPPTALAREQPNEAKSVCEYEQGDQRKKLLEMILRNEAERCVTHQ